MFATPHSLVLRVQVCDYCEKKSEYHITCETRLHGILTCTFHRHLADRDVQAWFRAKGLVKQRHFLEIYPEISKMTINVPRTDGSITAGGNLSEEPWQFIEKLNGKWLIQVLFKEPNGEIKNKYVNLQDFDKSGVSEEVIEEWLTTLDGFYKMDEIANTLAKETGTEKNIPAIPGIVPVYSNGTVVGTAYLPPGV